MENLHQRDAGDAEKIGRVGGQQAGLDDSHDLEDKGCRRSSDSDIEARIKKIILVFQKLEFEVGVPGARLDLTDSADADAVDGDLQAEKDGEGDQIGEVHGGFTPRLDFSRGRGVGETQSIVGQRSGMEKRGLQNRG